MTFVHPLLLTGLLLVGVPILLHLLMRQKPKHLLFPAMRFLINRHRVNQRRMRLRHLLLLALRMFLIALVCLALSRPKIFSERFNISGDRPVAAVLVFDTSPSMGYMVGQNSRLDEARRRAQEVLDELPEGSRVAILDTGDTTEENFISVSQARSRIGSLEIRPANSPVTSQVGQAYDLFARLQDEQSSEERMMPFLYVFSDRTQSCWDSRALENLQRSRDRVTEPKVYSLFVDVGVEEPLDHAVYNIELPRQIVPANEPVVVRAHVRAVGIPEERECVLACRRYTESDPVTIDRKLVKLAPGRDQVVTFELRGLPIGQHQVGVAFPTGDAALAFNDERRATFEVRGPQKVLLVTDRKDNAGIFDLALTADNSFGTEIMATEDARRLTPAEMAKYKAVCLVNVAAPGDELWTRLEQYALAGGGVAVIPGGENLVREDYTTVAARRVLPASFDKVVKATAKHGAVWKLDSVQHAVLAPVREWDQAGNVDFMKEGLEPSATRYWKIKDFQDADVVLSMKDGEEKPPALLETRKDMKGRILMFTSPMDDPHIDPGGQGPWNNYLQTSFYLVMANKLVGYLAGDLADGLFNFQCGQVVVLPLPATPRYPTYTVKLVGQGAEGIVVARPAEKTELEITKAVQPGNYQVLGEGKQVGCFTLEVPLEESDLTRVPVEQIRELFGPDGVLPVDAKTDLRSALQNHWSQPLELFPLLMIALLIFLAVENLLANKFYKQEAPTEEPKKVVLEEPLEAVAAE